MEHPGNRVDSGIEMLTERVRQLEENAVFNKTPTRHDNNDGMTAAYVQQIKLLTADFYQEREEREKLASKMNTLQMLLKHNREKYQTLYHEVLAIQNGNDTSPRKGTEHTYKDVE